MPTIDSPFGNFDQPGEHDKDPVDIEYTDSQIPTDIRSPFDGDDGQTILDEEISDCSEAVSSADEVRAQHPMESRYLRDDVSGSYNRLQVAARDELRLEREFNQIRVLMREARTELIPATYVYDDEIKNLTEDVEDLLGQVVQLVREIISAGEGQSPDRAGEAMTVMSAAQDAAANLASEAELIAPKNATGRVARIVRKVASCAKWLWNIISHLVTPKGWTLSGGISVPGLANAGISITFGNPDDAR